MKVIVLGAGIIGTASAWFLNKAGCEVTVIDRQPGAARETSFANGCQISVSHAEPWANPAAPKKIWDWLGQEDAPLLYRFRPEWLQWKWGLQFLRECTPKRTDSNIRQILAIAEYSRQTLQAVRAETGIDYDCLTRGILHFYTDQRDFEKSLAVTQLMRELGCGRESITAEQAIAIEPALAGMRGKIVGGDYTASDESGDVYKFTTALAGKAAQGGRRVPVRHPGDASRRHRHWRGSDDHRRRSDRHRWPETGRCKPMPSSWRWAVFPRRCCSRWESI